MAPVTTMATNTVDFTLSVGCPVGEQSFHVSENTMVSRNRKENETEDNPFFKHVVLFFVIMFNFIVDIYTQ